MIDDRSLTTEPSRLQALAYARQEIEALRRWYGVATDLLGNTGDRDAQDEGLRIYHRIFAPNADISVEGGAKPLRGEGPIAWSEVAHTALKPYEATQHLIGTQCVAFRSAAFSDAPVTVTAGHATMSSYLQAWHAWPDRRLRLVMGTYEDEVKFAAGVGWQITKMVLRHVSGEHRHLGAAEN